LRAEAAIATHSIEAFEVQPQARLMRPIADAPRLTASACEPVREIEIVDELGMRRAIFIPPNARSPCVSMIANWSRS
jgi:hypothetical protein